MGKKIFYHVPFFSNVTGRGIQEKNGYLYCHESEGERFYFFVSHDIDRYGRQLKTWGVDEFYTGLSIIRFYNTRFDAIAGLKDFIRNRGILPKINEIIKTGKIIHEILNDNPESFSHDIIDLSV